MLLRDGVLYFAVSVAIGIVDIVFLEAINQPTVASTVIPLHIALASVMTTRLVNNVFHILKADEVGPHFMTNTRPSGQNVKTMTANSGMVFVQGASAATGSSGTVLVVGSGVGTDYFDEISPTEGGASTTTVATKSSAYAIPLSEQSQTESVGSNPKEGGERFETTGNMV